MRDFNLVDPYKCTLRKGRILMEQTDGQTDKQILGHHIEGYVDFFFQINLLPPYSLHLLGDNHKDAGV